MAVELPVAVTRAPHQDSFLAWASLDGLHLPGRADLLPFLYLSLVAGGVAMLVQTWAQAHVTSGQAAVVMALEPVWAAFFGFALWGESLDGAPWWATSSCWWRCSWR